MDNLYEYEVNELNFIIENTIKFSDELQKEINKNNNMNFLELFKNKSYIEKNYNFNAYLNNLSKKSFDIIVALYYIGMLECDKKPKQPRNYLNKKIEEYKEFNREHMTNKIVGCCYLEKYLKDGLSVIKK